MEQAQKWKEIFGISPQDLAQWTKNAGSEAELLRWCLLNGKVDERAYLDWAMKSYELPSVKPSFFAIPADPVLWDLVKDQYPWTPSLFPLAIWNDLLLIACIEPPKDFRFRQAHRFVLASAQSLHQHWMKLNPGWTAKVPVAAVITPPPVVRPAPAAATPPPVAAPPPVAPAPPPPVITVAPSAPPVSPVAPAAPSFEAPEGIVLDASDFGTAADAQANLSETAELGSANEPEFEAPEGLNFGPSVRGHAEATASEAALPDFGDAEEIKVELPDGIASETVISSLNLDFSSLHEPASASAGVKTESDPTIPIHVKTESDPTIPIHVKAESDPTIPIHQPDEITATVTGAALPSNVIDFPQSSDSGHIVPSNLNAIPLEACDTKDMIGNQALANVLKTFEHGMFFLVENDGLRPWKWTDRLIVTDSSNPSLISLESPSIFRIAFRTQQPYHGYVTPSPVNNAFFTEFYQGALPKHVTLAPIVVNRKIVGMLMGLTDTEIAYRNSLIQMERLTDMAARRMVELRLAS